MFTLFSTLILGGILIKESVDTTMAEKAAKEAEEYRRRERARHNYNLQLQRNLHSIYCQMNRELKDIHKKYNNDFLNDTQSSIGYNNPDGSFHCYTGSDRLARAMEALEAQGYEWDHSDFQSNRCFN